MRKEGEERRGKRERRGEERGRKEEREEGEERRGERVKEGGAGIQKKEALSFSRKEDNFFSISYVCLCVC